MLVVETIAKICRAFFVQGKPIKVICRELRLSRKVVRKVIRSKATEFHYEREAQPLPKIGPWSEKLDQLLSVNEAKVARERLTLIRLFEELRGLGYDGGYDAVRRYARRWAKERGQSTAAAYVPLSFAPGEAYQFDWSHEVVLLSGVTGDYPTTKPKGGFGRPFCFDVLLCARRRTSIGADNGQGDCEVVQFAKGLRIYSAARWRQGCVCPHLSGGASRPQRSQ